MGTTPCAETINRPPHNDPPTVSLRQRFHQLHSKTSRAGCQKAADEQPQGRATTAAATRTQATATAGVVRLQGTATPMPMDPLTTTMGLGTASTTPHLVEHSRLAARPTPPTTTTMPEQLPPRPNSQSLASILKKGKSNI